MVEFNPGGAASLAESVKTLNENNADTNAFTDAEKTKLGTVATSATANATDAALRGRATHTGVQAISTVSGLQTSLDNIEAKTFVALTQAEYDALAGGAGYEAKPYFVTDTPAVYFGATPFSNALGTDQIALTFGIESVAGVAELTVDNVGNLTLTITGGILDGVYAADSSATTLTAATIITTTAIIVDPVVTGTAGTGEVLTAQPSLFLWLVDEPAAPTYQWQRDGVDIAGATALTYTQVVADEGTDVTFLETYDGVTATSNAITVPVVAAPTFTLFDQLDASDAATITDTAGEVSAWGDSGVNANTWAQASAGARPTTGLITQNGLNVISFDNTDHLAASSPPDFAESGVMFLAFRVNTVASAFNALVGLDLPGADLMQFQAGASTWFGQVSSSRHSTVGRITETHNVWVVQAYAWDINTNRASFWTNGVMDQEVFDYTVPYEVVPSRIFINANQASFGNPDSDIAEYKMYSGTMSDAVIQTKMSELQTKWGI